MIAWYWLITVAIVAGMIGAVIGAACAAAARGDRQIGATDHPTPPQGGTDHA